MNQTSALFATALAALMAALPAAKRRLELSVAKHRSLTGHARIAKRLAELIPGYAYDEARFFASDRAPVAVVQQRREALARLSERFAACYARSLALTAEAAEGLSDLQFTGAYRVPFQYSRYLSDHLKAASFDGRARLAAACDDAQARAAPAAGRVGGVRRLSLERPGARLPA